MRWAGLLRCLLLLALATAPVVTHSARADETDLKTPDQQTLDQMVEDLTLLTIEPPPPDLARIYFYRLNEPLLIALSPDVVVNGRSVGELSMGEVFFRDARPGRYQVFLSGDTQHVVELVLTPGDISYVRATLRIGFGTTRITAEAIVDSVAAREINAMENPVEVSEPQPKQR